MAITAAVNKMYLNPPMCEVTSPNRHENKRMMIRFRINSSFHWVGLRFGSVSAMVPLHTNTKEGADSCRDEHRSERTGANRPLTIAFPALDAVTALLVGISGGMYGLIVPVLN
jgi:hypothetical protein